MKSYRGDNPGHGLQFAREAGSNMSADEVAAFLDQNGRAQNVRMP